MKEVLNRLDQETSNTQNTIFSTMTECNDQRDELNGLLKEMEELAALVKKPVILPAPLAQIDLQINQDIDGLYDCISPGKSRLFPKLTTLEIMISVISGLLAAAIDIVLVGTPEVVKIYHGGENFDGSILTKLLRKYGNGEDNLGIILHWLSEKCKVPYDISLQSGVVTPNNHRIRSLGHDPFFGLFFAVADILMGTTTCIDNSGKLVILLAKQQADPIEKLLSVFYYIGHILSDVCTARGIPIPGFFLTQFFANGSADRSIAKIAENMYRDGYDLRHLISMSVPVAVKDLIISAYLYMTKEEIPVISSIYSKEFSDMTSALKKEKMCFIANLIATTENLAKTIIASQTGNLNAINAAQWYTMIINSINMARGALRDQSAETIVNQRSAIDKKWAELLDSAESL